MNRTCKNCATTDPSQFYETQHSHYCRPCHRARYFGKGRARRDAAKMARGECAECHLKVTPENLCVFEFDHTRDKKYDISAMTTLKDEKFNEEIEKCVLVCSNCHRIRTLRDGGYSRPPKNPAGRPRKNPSPEPHTAPSVLTPSPLGETQASSSVPSESTPLLPCAMT